MSSILTNTSAMVALQTLKSINSNLMTTQNAISTGKTIARAEDNSAIWAISQIMDSDVTGFRAVDDSLRLGESTVAVATAGAEQIVNILTDMKAKVVAATGENVDHTKITADINELKAQIASIISASQFNGANLLNTAGGNLSILASLDRDAAGAVTAGNITVNSVDFETSLDLTTVVTTDATTAAASLDDMETLIQTSINGAAALGASSKRVGDQIDFVGKVIDAMVSGVGALVDTDMEEASARLQALQVQQQLGLQALSIANQSPQNLLSLFQ